MVINTGIWPYPANLTVEADVQVVLFISAGAAEKYN
jgi:hypothetical protein